MSGPLPSLALTQLEHTLTTEGLAALLQMLRKTLTSKDPNDMQRRVYELVIQVVRLERDFLSRHPQELFSRLWNALWWASSPELLSWYPSSTREEFTILSDESLANAIQAHLSSWGNEKQAETPGFSWIRSLRPPAQLVGQGLVAKALWRGRGRNLLFSEDGHTLHSWGHEVKPRLVGFDEEESQNIEQTVSYAEMTWDWRHDLPVWTHWDEPFDGEPSEVPYPFINQNVSPDGKWRLGSVYSSNISDSSSLRILDAQTEESISILPVPEENEHYMFNMMGGIFSPDGRWVAGEGWEWDGEGMMCLWRLDLQPRRRFWRRAKPKHKCVLKHAPGPSIGVLAFSPDSCYLAVGFPHHVDIFETETQALKWSLKGLTESPQAIAFSPDNKYLAMFVGDSLQILSIEQASHKATPFFLELDIGWTGFSEYGFRLYQQPFLYDGWDGRLIARLYDRPGGYLEGGPPKPSHWLCERRLYSLYTTSLRSWAPQHAQSVELPGGERSIGGHSTRVAFGAGGRMLAFGLIERTPVHIMRPEEESDFFSCVGPPLSCLALSHDGVFLAVGSAADGSVVVFRTEDGAELWRTDEHAGRITHLLFSKDDASLLVASIDDQLTLRRVVDGTLLGQKSVGEEAVEEASVPDILSPFLVKIKWDPTEQALEEIDGWCGFDAGIPEGPYRYFVGEDNAELRSCKGDERKFIAAYPTRATMQAHPSGRIWANKDEHIVLEFGYPPSFPRASGQDPFVSLRQWLTQEPSEKSWLHICYLLDDAEEDMRDVLVQYTAEHTASWDVRLKRPLYSWWERARKGEVTGYEDLGLDWSDYL